jgi:hypothetical protein
MLLLSHIDYRLKDLRGLSRNVWVLYASKSNSKQRRIKTLLLVVYNGIMVTFFLESLERYGLIVKGSQINNMGEEKEAG